MNQFNVLQGNQSRNKGNGLNNLNRQSIHINQVSDEVDDEGNLNDDDIDEFDVSKIEQQIVRNPQQIQEIMQQQRNFMVANNFAQNLPQRPQNQQILQNSNNQRSSQGSQQKQNQIIQNNIIQPQIIYPQSMFELPAIQDINNQPLLSQNSSQNNHNQMNQQMNRAGSLILQQDSEFKKMKIHLHQKMDFINKKNHEREGKNYKHMTDQKGTTKKNDQFKNQFSVQKFDPNKIFNNASNSPDKKKVRKDILELENDVKEQNERRRIMKEQIDYVNSITGKVFEKVNQIAQNNNFAQLVQQPVAGLEPQQIQIMLQSLSQQILNDNKIKNDNFGQIVDKQMHREEGKEEEMPEELLNKINISILKNEIEQQKPKLNVAININNEDQQINSNVQIQQSYPKSRENADQSMQIQNQLNNIIQSIDDSQIMINNQIISDAQGQQQSKNQLLKEQVEFLIKQLKQRFIERKESIRSIIEEIKIDYQPFQEDLLHQQGDNFNQNEIENPQRQINIFIDQQCNHSNLNNKDDQHSFSQASLNGIESQNCDFQNQQKSKSFDEKNLMKNKQKQSQNLKLNSEKEEQQNEKSVWDDILEDENLSGEQIKKRSKTLAQIKMINELQSNNKKSQDLSFAILEILKDNYGQDNKNVQNENIQIIHQIVKSLNKDLKEQKQDQLQRKLKLLDQKVNELASIMPQSVSQSHLQLNETIKYVLREIQVLPYLRVIEMINLIILRYQTCFDPIVNQCISKLLENDLCEKEIDKSNIDIGQNINQIIQQQNNEVNSKQIIDQKMMKQDSQLFLNNSFGASKNQIDNISKSNSLSSNLSVFGQNKINEGAIVQDFNDNFEKEIQEEFIKNQKNLIQIQNIDQQIPGVSNIQNKNSKLDYKDLINLLQAKLNKNENPFQKFKKQKKINKKSLPESFSKSDQNNINSDMLQNFIKESFGSYMQLEKNKLNQIYKQSIRSFENIKRNDSLTLLQQKQKNYQSVDRFSSHVAQSNNGSQILSQMSQDYDSLNENQNLAPNFGMNISKKLSFRQIDENDDDDDQISFIPARNPFQEEQQQSLPKNQTCHEIIDQSLSPVKFLTKSEILNENYEFWTNLSLYDIQRDENFYKKLQKYARQSNKTKSIVMECVGQFVKLIDPAVDEFNLSEPNIKQFATIIKGQIYIAIIKIQPEELIKQLRRLAKYYEIIIFSILPLNIIHQIYQLVPEIDDCISFTLSYEDLEYQDGCACKDLGLLAENRSINLKKTNGQDEEPEPSEMIVIDIYPSEDVTDKTMTYVRGEEYTGSYKYKNIEQLIDIMKQYRLGTIQVEQQEDSNNQEYQQNQSVEQDVAVHEEG